MLVSEVAHDRRICDVTFSTNGATIATIACNDLKIWEAATGTRLGLRNVPLPVAMAFDPEYPAILVVGRNSDDPWDTSRRLCSYDALRGVRRTLLTWEADAEAQHAIPRNGKILAVVRGRNARVFARQPEDGSWKKRHEWQLDEDACGAALSQRGEWLAVALRNGVLQCWNTERQKKERQLDWSEGVTMLAVSEKTDLLAAATEGGTVILVDLQEGSVVSKFRPASGGRIDVLSLSPTGNLVAWSSATGRIVLSNARTGEPLCELRSTRAATQVNRLQFSPTGKVLAVAVVSTREYTGILELWDVAALLRGT